MSLDMEVDQPEDLWDWCSKGKEVKKKILQKGTWDYRSPIEGSVCKIIVSDIEGEWDSNLKSEEETTFTIGSGDSLLAENLERCLVKMYSNEVARLDLGKVKCTVKLLGFTTPETPEYFYDIDDAVKAASEHKEKGIDHFKNGCIIEAYARFRRAIRILIFAGKSDEKILPLYVAVCNNIALCHLKLKRPELGVEVCCKVLEHEPNNVKALLRRSACYQMTRDFEKAHSDLLRVLEIEPNNPKAKEMLPTVKADINDMNKRYKSMVKKMLGVE